MKIKKSQMWIILIIGVGILAWKLVKAKKKKEEEGSVGTSESTSDLKPPVDDLFID